MMLITLDQAKKQCEVPEFETAHDEFLEELIQAASETVVDYVKSASGAFIDSSGEVIEDAVPFRVVQACRLTVADWFKNREGQRENAVPSEFGYGYAMPAAATALLYSMRVPTLA